MTSAFHDGPGDRGTRRNASHTWACSSSAFRKFLEGKFHIIKGSTGERTPGSSLEHGIDGHPGPRITEAVHLENTGPRGETIEGPKLPRSVP